MDINVKIYVNGKNYKTLCKTVINADTVKCEISFDNHSFDVEFDNTAITLKNIDGLKVDTVKTLRFKANFTSMKKFKWGLMDIVTDIVGLLADRHIGYKNMEELYDNAIKNHCIKPVTTEAETATETKPETATDSEDNHIEVVKKFKEKADLNSSYGEATEPLTAYQSERLTRTLYKSLFKAIGLEETKKMSFIISNNMVFFNYNGVQYKYYPPQCKIFKKCGRKYQRINWKDFADDNSSTGQKQALGRSPPLLLI